MVPREKVNLENALDPVPRYRVEDRRMHKPILPILSVAVLAATGLSFAATPDFSGEWQFVPAKSRNAGMMAQMKITDKVRQSADTLVITSTSVFNDMELTSEIRLDLTGKPVENTMPMSAKAETVSRWEDSHLVTTWTTPGSAAGTRSVRVETRSLSADGKTMTVESAREKGPAMVMVYERAR